MAVPTRVGRLLDHRVESGEANDLRGPAEAPGLTDLGRQGAGDQGPHAVEALQRPGPGVLAGKGA
jgi:hypothetical protein